MNKERKPEDLKLLPTVAALEQEVVADLGSQNFPDSVRNWAHSRFLTGFTFLVQSMS